MARPHYSEVLHERLGVGECFQQFGHFPFQNFEDDKIYPVIFYIFEVFAPEADDRGSIVSLRDSLSGSLWK